MLPGEAQGKQLPLPEGREQRFAEEDTSSGS